MMIIHWRLKQRLEDLPYLLDANSRKLPDFLVIGVTKGGTTSLHKYLDQHPEIQMSRRKEPLFFSHNYKRGIRYYRSYFPKESEGKITGESSTTYISDAKVPARVKKHLPNVKIILLLRDPVRRAFSHHRMNINGFTPNKFDDAIEDELRRYNENNKVVFRYIYRSMYYQNLQPWLEHFRLEDMLILKSEDFFQDTKQELKKVYDYLGLSEVYPKDLKAANQREYDPIDQDTYKKHYQIFAEDSENLKALLGEKFSWKY